MFSKHHYHDMKVHMLCQKEDAALELDCFCLLSLRCWLWQMGKDMLSSEQILGLGLSNYIRPRWCDYCRKIATSAAIPILQTTSSILCHSHELSSSAMPSTSLSHFLTTPLPSTNRRNMKRPNNSRPTLKVCLRRCSHKVLYKLHVLAARVREGLIKDATTCCMQSAL